MNSLSLEEFIYQVKRELLEAQEKHEGESAFLELQKVELEVSIVVSKTANGRVNVYVAQVGSDISKEQVQRVRLAFEVIDLLQHAPSRKRRMKTSGTLSQSRKKVLRGHKRFA